ncbi:hypothetical protein ACWCQ0_45900 [Streptomyces massasporeus]
MNVNPMHSPSSVPSVPSIRSVSSVLSVPARTATRRSVLRGLGAATAAGAAAVCLPAAPAHAAPDGRRTHRASGSYALTLVHLGRDGAPTTDYRTLLTALSGPEAGTGREMKESTSTVTVQVPAGRYLLDCTLSTRPVGDTHRCRPLVVRGWSGPVCHRSGVRGVRNVGRDPTPDGTCIRDYIHVADIADAHLAAARALVAAGEAGETAALTLNIGRGEGVSVREMVDLINEITGHSIEPLVTPRRPGDPARVVASAERIESQLGWKAQHDVRSMISSAWEGWGANRAVSATV